MEQYYVILGLPVTASREDVKKAFRDLAKQWHPDRFHNDPEKHQEAEKKFKLINEAYTRLLSYHANKQNPLGDDFAYQSSQSTIKVERISPEILYQSGIVCAEQGKYQEAIEEFTRAIRCDAGFIKAYQYRGFILEKLGYKKRAEADFKKVKGI